MKANRKFLNGDDAVSPVIAVILMVAITVVLAATVYVWVSGFGAQSGNPQKSISLTSSGALDNTNNNKTYTVASGTSGMKWSDVSFTLNGAPLSHANLTTAAGAAAAGYCVWDPVHGTCYATQPAGVISAGDLVYIHDTGAMSGKTLRIVDAQANAVMLTLTIG